MHKKTMEIISLEALGLPKRATKAEIKARYRKLVAREHPDKNPGDPFAAARLSNLTAAYEWLMEPAMEPSQSLGAAGVDDDVIDPDTRPVPEELRTLQETYQGATPTIGRLVALFVIVVICLQPIGFWARDEFTSRCTFGSVDKQYCSNLVPVRCAGEVFMGDVGKCLADGRLLVKTTDNITDESYIEGLCSMDGTCP
eukprot:TRINITY_DN31832_c0_g1_i1.p1 TRINITY_DN31832_c0_g1~~TRINITY_DN31832_c0_g1_i1.p1  ORF type:complete len:198 (-),score=29.45 TRINITY_DN31832_c0_g1_i1:177-770(-)